MKDSLYQKTKKARKVQRKAVDIESKLEGQRKAECEEARARNTRDSLFCGRGLTFSYYLALGNIEDKYRRLLKIARCAHTKADNKLLALGEEFHSYAKFNSAEIVQSMASFISYVEGERYIPAHSYEAGQNSIIIKRSRIKDEKELEEGINGVNPEISEEEMKAAYYAGEEILLDNGYSNGVDLFNEIGTLNYSIGHFTYLHEFFNRFIQFRIDNNIKYAVTGTDWIFEFMAWYLQSHPELVKMNEDKRNAMLREELDDYTWGCARLELLKGE